MKLLEMVGSVMNLLVLVWQPSPVGVGKCWGCFSFHLKCLSQFAIPFSFSFVFFGIFSIFLRVGRVFCLLLKYLADRDREMS